MKISMIKEAQRTDETLSLIVENCLTLQVTPAIVESLDGVLKKVALEIGKGTPQSVVNLSTIQSLALAYGLAEYIGALDGSEVSPPGANAIMDLYKTVGSTGLLSQKDQDMIHHVMDQDPQHAQQLRGYSAKWGKFISSIAQSAEKNPAMYQQAMKKLHQYTQKTLANMNNVQTTLLQAQTRNKETQDRAAMQKAMGRRSVLGGNPAQQAPRAPAAEAPSLDFTR